MKAENALTIMLLKRGAERTRPAKWLSMRLGISEPTARSIIKDPSKLTVGIIRTLKLNDEEIRELIG